MGIVITYELGENKTSEFKSQLLSMGYSTFIIHKDASHHEKKACLPNTSLYHPNKSNQQALDDLVSVAKSLSIILDKAIVTTADPHHMLWGNPP